MDYIGAGVLAMTPREAGRLIGSLFVVLLLLAGLIKCFQISRRPTASTVCVSSLALLLLAWLMVAGSALLLGDPSDLAQALISVAAGVMVLTAIVLAIVGLVLFHQKPRRFEQGSGQALTTLLLGGLVLTLMGGGFVAGLIERHESLNPEPVATDDGEVIRRAHLNYQLERIEPGWISVDPKAFNERASVMLRRARPPMGFAILVEQTGAGLIDDRELAEAVHANLGAASSIARFTSPQPVRIGGIDGLELSGTARLGGHRVSYLFWVAEHNGQSIQIVGWSASEHRTEMERDVRRIRDTFRLIDADKVFQTSSELALGVVEEPTFGYRLDLRDTGWQEWTTRASDFPEAVTAGLSGTTSAMGVVPIPLHEHNPSLDQLRRALLASMGLADGGGHWALAQPWPMGDTRGERRVLRSPANPDFVYEVGVLKRPGMAYGVIAWDAASVPEHQRQAPEILDRFQLTRISGLTPRVVDLAHTRSLAEIYNRLGILEYEAGLYQRAYLYFERASRLAPDVSAYFANGVESLLDDGQGAQAQERLERFGHRFTANPRVQRLRARTLLTVGRHDEAIEQYAMLFERDQATADDLQDYVDLLIQAGRVDEADAVSEAFCEERPSLSASLVRVHLFRVREQWQRGVAMLERLAERNRSVEVQQELADFYFQVDRSADSARVAQDLIDRGQGAAWNYFLLGRAMHDLARYREAKAAFERCVQLEPADTGYRDWLAYSSQMLGQGENWQVTTPIEPLAIPEPLQRQLAGEDLWPVPEDAGAGYLHRVTVYRFEPGQPLRKTTYRRIRIVAASALDLFTTVQIGFDPALSRLHLNHARVLDERGRILAQTRLEDVYVLDDTSSGTATQEKLLNVPIPGLRPGATLEYAWTEETLAPSDRLPYEHRLMTATLPTRIEAVALRGTVSESNVQTQGPIERRTLEDGLLFTIREPVVYRWEPHQPRLESFLPWLTMGDPDQSWEDVARDFLSEIEEQMKPTAPVVARARELTAGAATEGEKIRRVAEFVQSRLRYTAIEFGVRGRMPNPAEQTMKNAYGDCKDHAVLLHSLLQAADVPASLVLVNIGAAIDLRWPTLDQFDHMIVYTPRLGGGRFIDATDKHSPVLSEVPLGLGGVHALMLDASQPRMVRIPDHPAGARSISLDRQLRIAEDGAIHGVDTMTVTGSVAGYLRGWLRNLQASDRTSSVQRLLGGYGATELKVQAIDHLDDPQAPLVMRVAYRAVEPLHRERDRMVGRLPVPWERHHLEPTATEERRFPFEIREPLRFSSSIELQWPRGYRLKTADPKAGGDTAPLRWSVQPSGAKVELSLRLSRGVFSADRFAGYARELRSALEALRGPIVLSR